ncbi:MAG: hypothetical protein GY707_12245, partial [Desulfobacteraceae bacterium]|nr:hypothetical protein [Desulfobacteraceae bacterium]
AATKVVYLPKKSDLNSEAIEALKEEIDALEEEIENTEDIDEARELREERRELFYQYYVLQERSQAYIDICMLKLEIEDEMAELDSGSEEYQLLEEALEALHDEYQKLKFEEIPELFRITESNNITLERFLMFSLKAYNLVSILRHCTSIKVIDCDLINPYWKKGQLSDHIEFNEDSGMSHGNEEIEMEKLEDKFGWASKKLRIKYSSCIRMTSCCQIEIRDNCLAGAIGILQQGEYEPDQMPVIDEFKCVNNRILIEMTGLALLEVQNALIKDNLVYHIGAGVPEEAGELLEELIEDWLALDNTCQAKDDELIDEIIDTIRELIFGCTPEEVTGLIKNRGGIFAYSVLYSRIENNRIWANIGIHLFYSKANKIKNNQVIAGINALTLLYNFQTKIIANTLNVTGSLSRINNIDDQNIDDLIKADLEEEIKYGKDTNKYSYGIRETLGRIFKTDKSVAVRVHFSDRQVFTDNQVQGDIGWVSNAFDINEYFHILGTYTEFWTTPLQGEAAVLLIREFLDNMGLTPAIHLFETLLSVFTGGVEIDWIAFMVEEMTGGQIIFKDLEIMRESTGLMGVSEKFTENPFVRILVRLFQLLINLQVVSRTKLLHNRFDIMKPDLQQMKLTGKPAYKDGTAGIVMMNGITLGGVRIEDNRIAGASHTAIMWQALAVINNPEFLGLILHFFYKYTVLILIWLRDFLQTLVDIFEGIENGEDEDSTSSIFVVVALFILFGVGTICPNLETNPDDDPDDPDAEPENPFLIFLRELVDALTDLIDQLNNGEVEHTIKDLMNNDDRLNSNQIRGMGNGIHTNIANTLIATNRIDVTPGPYAIAELFAMGRLFATHQLIHTDYDEETGEQINHSSVAYFGYALMSLNPYMVSDAKDMMLDSPEQWNNLTPVLEMTRLVAENSNASQELAISIQGIQNNLGADGNADELKAETEKLFDGILNQLKGYGMILQAPGMQVLDNRIEAALECDISKLKHQPLGGILMTCKSNFQNIISYLLLIEEGFPIGNIGGQGTEFTGNSLQWGAGHGLSL